MNWFQKHKTELIPQPFPSQAVKIFLGLSILFWISATVLLQFYSGNEIYKFVNQHNCELGDTIFPIITRFGEIIIIGPALLLAFFLRKKENRTLAYFVTILLCNAVPVLINTTLKNLYTAPRPMKLFEKADWFHYVQGQPYQYHLSFPSGHTCGVFAMMTFLCSILPNKYKWWSIPFFFVALMTGFSRIYLSQHFFQDVFAGSMIGTIFCILTYSILDKLKK